METIEILMKEHEFGDDEHIAYDFKNEDDEEEKMSCQREIALTGG